MYDDTIPLELQRYFELLEITGKGAFGIVYKARYRSGVRTNKIVALKKQMGAFQNTNDAQKNIQRNHVS